MRTDYLIVLDCGITSTFSTLLVIDLHEETASEGFSNVDVVLWTIEVSGD